MVAVYFGHISAAFCETVVCKALSIESRLVDYRAEENSYIHMNESKLLRATFPVYRWSVFGTDINSFMLESTLLLSSL